jgi:hypothetical protein
MIGRVKNRYRRGVSESLSKAFKARDGENIKAPVSRGP